MNAVNDSNFYTCYAYLEHNLQKNIRNQSVVDLFIIVRVGKYEFCFMYSRNYTNFCAPHTILLGHIVFRFVSSFVCPVSFCECNTSEVVSPIAFILFEYQYFINNIFFMPPATKLQGDILVSPCPSVRLQTNPMSYDNLSCVSQNFFNFISCLLVKRGGSLSFLTIFTFAVPELLDLI